MKTDENKRFAIFRKSEGLNQTEMAELLSTLLSADINQSFISAVESFKRPVPEDYAKALHIHKLLNYEWFYSGTGTMKITGQKDKSLVTNTAELLEEIERLKHKINSMDGDIAILWKLAFPDEK